MGAKQTSKHRKYKVVGFVDASGNDYNELNKEITIVLCEQENGHTFPFSIKEFPKGIKVGDTFEETTTRVFKIL